MNKNIFYTAIFLLGVIIFSYFIPTKEGENREKREILSTTVMIDSLVKEIVGDKFSTELLIEGEIDPHSYQMRKGDREKIERAEIVFANGLSLEHNPSLYYMLNDRSAVFIGDRLLETSPNSIITNQKEVDPHIWMDLDLMQSVALMICKRVCEADLENCEFYQTNTKALQKKMKVLDLEISEMFKSVPAEKLYLVSSHDAFNYFVRRYFIQDNKNRLFSMQGLSTESEVSLKRISQVISYIRNNNIPVVFFESNLPKDGLYKVIEICKRFDMDVKISGDPLYGDTLGGMTYLDMMKHNAMVMTKNLKMEGDSD